MRQKLKIISFLCLTGRIIEMNFTITGIFTNYIEPLKLFRPASVVISFDSIEVNHLNIFFCIFLKICSRKSDILMDIEK